MIRLFIAFGEWLKLNFNVLSGNFISLLSVDTEWHGRNESCWSKWPENINWPSGPIFVQFDWPDRKYTGHGPAVTLTPVYIDDFLKCFKDYDHCLVKMAEKKRVAEVISSDEDSMPTPEKKRKTVAMQTFRREYSNKYPWISCGPQTPGLLLFSLKRGWQVCIYTS